MVIERFKPGAATEIYRRAQEQGRMLPDGLEYVASWVGRDLTICFQLMQTEQEELFARWISHWQDLAEFEIIPVMTSAEAFSLIAPEAEKLP